jgi:hypothetical protein
MPRHSTFPTLYDDALQISITKLKEYGYINNGFNKSGTLTWSSRGEKTGSISIGSKIIDEVPNILLKYNYKDQPRNYNVQLVSSPSNLGNGKTCYFLCSVTEKRCRILYSIDGHFLHREAFKGCYYESQIQSKKWRWMDKLYGDSFKLDSLYEQLYQKYFKKTYAGKPTKKYLKLRRKIDHAESNCFEAFEFR